MNPQYIGIDVIAGNFSFKNLKSGLIKVSKKIGTRQKEVISIETNVLAEVEDQLEFILSQIKNDDFTQVVDIKACEWCDYKTVCKR